MIKILTVFAAGAVTGLLVAMMFRADANLVKSSLSEVEVAFDSAPGTIAVDTERTPSYEDLMERISDLEGLVSALVGELQDVRASASNASSSQPQALSRVPPPFPGAPPELVEQLVSEGFSQERAEWIKTRYDELSAEANELRWDLNYNL